MARPKKKIDEKLVKDLASIMCTMIEIASICGCSVDTLERRFADVIKEGQNIGKTSLRRWQYLAAQKGNVTMLIWLGKQFLGQKDRQETEITSYDNTVVLSYAKDGSHLKKEEDKKDE